MGGGAERRPAAHRASLACPPCEAASEAQGLPQSVQLSACSSRVCASLPHGEDGDPGLQTDPALQGLLGSVLLQPLLWA